MRRASFSLPGQSPAIVYIFIDMGQPPFSLQAFSGFRIDMFLIHVLRIPIGGVIIIHQSLVPITIRYIQCLPAQLIGDLSSLVMFADGVGAGGEQAVDGMLFVLFLLPHHSSILSAGHAAVLRCDAVTVFRNMGTGRQKVAMTVAAPTGAMTMLQSVHQIEHIKINESLEYDLVNSYPFIFITRVLNMIKTGNQPWLRKEFFDLAKRHLLQQDQKIIILIKAFVCSLCERTLCPLGQSAEVFVFKCAYQQAKTINCNQDLQNILTELKKKKCYRK